MQNRHTIVKRKIFYNDFYPYDYSSFRFGDRYCVVNISAFGVYEFYIKRKTIYSFSLCYINERPICVIVVFISSY